ncbi:hypothetical protein [Daejeonella sp. H1SJ63]|uniref:hypothetical protein n=1 Tax=Daejeonella sp. H1SJ63 TaxID=3034145 RepID=UPI0023EE290E|nr:hypothetical protein [Daejeonella sp. H1SJ63]
MHYSYWVRFPNGAALWWIPLSDMGSTPNAKEAVSIKTLLKVLFFDKTEEEE